MTDDRLIRHCHALVRQHPAPCPVIVERVKASHPYEVPGISSRQIIGGNPDYLSWILEETSA